MPLKIISGDAKAQDLNDNFAYSEELVRQVNAGPKGTYATLSALQTAFPTGTSGIYVVTADGKWYYWSGSAWTAGGVYQAVLGLASTPGTDSNKTLTQLAVTKELGLNFSNNGLILTSGVFSNTNPGWETRWTTDFIRISRDKDITFLCESNNQFAMGFAFYTKTKTFISGIVNNQTVITSQTILKGDIPADARYIRVAANNAILINAFVSFGGVQSSILAAEQAAEQAVASVAQNLESMEMLLSNKINSKIDVLVGKNLFNKDSKEIIFGKYLSSAGIHAVNNLYYISEFIPVEPETIYSHANFEVGGAFCCFYDENKIFINSFKNTPITSPANASYLRMSGIIAKIDIQQVETGGLPTAYEAYTPYAPVEGLSKRLTIVENTLPLAIRTVLPNKLYFVKDKQLCIYHENVMYKNLNEAAAVVASQGYDYTRLTAFNLSTPTITEQNLTLQVIRNMQKGQIKTLKYEVIDPAVNNGKTANVLCIGDSFTDIGTWVSELKTLLNSAGVTVNQIGTCGNSTFKAEGLSGGTLLNTFLNNSMGVARVVDVTGMTTIPATGFPGRTYRDGNGNDWIIRGGKIDGSGNGRIVVTKPGATNSDFATFPSTGVLTKQTTGEGDATINYSNPVAIYHNPFINGLTGLLDVSNYINFWGFNVPDVVVFQFTWNDIGTWATDSAITTLVNNFKLAADHIHSNYENAKVIFAISPYGSVNGNLDWHGKKYSVLKLVESMILNIEENPTYNTWAFISPAYACVDLVYGYSDLTVAPTNRYPSVIEQSGGDGIHPSSMGMRQIADVVYATTQYVLTV
jgi:hypothetical protein